MLNFRFAKISNCRFFHQSHAALTQKKRLHLILPIEGAEDPFQILPLIRLILRLLCVYGRGRCAIWYIVISYFLCISVFDNVFMGNFTKMFWSVITHNRKCSLIRLYRLMQDSVSSSLGKLLFVIETHCRPVITGFYLVAYIRTSCWRHYICRLPPINRERLWPTARPY